MDKLKLTDIGGFPFKLDDKLWENGELDASNKGQYDALQAILDQYGTDYIVSGCTYAAPNLTAGWIMLGGELLYVAAQAGTTNFFEKVTTTDARGTKTFKDTNVYDTYQINRGVLSAVSGALDITTADRLGDKIIKDMVANSTEKFGDANLPAATTTVKGIVEKATTAEAQAGTSEKYLDAALLQLVTATETRKGIVEKATLTEIIAKTADKYIDALLLNTHEAWQTSVTYNGAYVAGTVPIRYRRLNNGLLQLNGNIAGNPGFPTGVLLILTLPVNYRPTSAQTFTASASDGTIHTFTLATNGQISSVAEFNFQPFLNNILPLD
jgi:hypothetical protein